MKFLWTPNCHRPTISNHYTMFYCIYFRRNSSFTYDLWYHINSSEINFLLWVCKMLVFMWNNTLLLLMQKKKSLHRCDFNEVTILFSIFLYLYNMKTYRLKWNDINIHWMCYKTNSIHILFLRECRIKTYQKIHCHLFYKDISNGYFQTIIKCK